MNGNYFDPLWTSKVTVPVKRVGSHWEFFYGGDVPVKEGTMGALTLSADQITDQRFLQRVTQELTVKILAEGQPLLVALSDRSKSSQRIGEWPAVSPLGVPPGTTRFERITLGPPKPKLQEKVNAAQQVLEGLDETGGLWLRLKGLERSELIGSTVVMPIGFATATATSLNHAVTLLSQAYEKHRISNTGNVYTRVFYLDQDNQWHPLSDLRGGVQAATERKLLNNLWSQVEQALGWRPVPQERKKLRK